MKLEFNIEYRTVWGETICVTGNVAELGNGNADSALPLTTADGIHWHGCAYIDSRACVDMHYHYLVCRDGSVEREEWHTAERTIVLCGNDSRTFLLHDSWKDTPDNEYLYSSAFTNAWMRHETSNTADVADCHRRTVTIKAYIPCGENVRPCVCGSNDVLGHWNADKVVAMESRNYPEWSLTFDAGTTASTFEYKIILVDTKTGQLVAWEDGINRYADVPQLSDGASLVIADAFPKFSLPQWRGAGTCIPVFSLRTEGSFGIGDFGDLKVMVQWAAATGQSIVQLLPVNDTTMTGTWIDSYPYNSISVYALNPMYLDLRQMCALDGKDDARRFAQLQKKLNALPTLDYEAVFGAKREYARLCYAKDGQQTMASDDYKDFARRNSAWLLPYAAFSYLRDMYGTADFRQWPAHTVYDAGEVEHMFAADHDAHDAMAFYCYVQYHLDRQLYVASIYARWSGIVLKGDIPIGISRNSVEAWTEPRYFNMDSQAGAPPDDFSANGQNWGFPTYNWDVMAQDGYAWWTERLKGMSRYFDAYRIDHILGFFRIWEIPLDSVHGLLGRFSPSLPMDIDEILAFGLPFNEALYTRPFISDDSVCDLFGAQAEYVKTNFLTPAVGRKYMYDMRPQYDTQRKVQAYFASRQDEASVKLREGLYSLISDVLFIRDRDHANLYHPRISAQQTYVYKSLDESTKASFDCLYNDYYYHRHNDFWAVQAMKKLPAMMHATGMLVCGEDLGMIPHSVPQVMDRLHILSLEVQRMPKEMFREFADVWHYPYPSVCTISTHDMSTLRGWWTENHAVTQRFYNDVLGHQGAAPAEATPEICREVVDMHLKSASMLCVISLQDWLSMDGTLRSMDVDGERINVPAIPRYYWRYRMHMSLEQLLMADGLNDRIAGMIRESGR